MRICFLVTWLFVLTLCMLSLCCNVFVSLIATTHAIRTKHASTWKETSNQLTAHKTATHMHRYEIKSCCGGFKLHGTDYVAQSSLLNWKAEDEVHCIYLSKCDNGFKIQNFKHTKDGEITSCWRQIWLHLT